jgi:hypothetical protein
VALEIPGSVAGGAAVNQGADGSLVAWPSRPCASKMPTARLQALATVFTQLFQPVILVRGKPASPGTPIER